MRKLNLFHSLSVVLLVVLLCGVLYGDNNEKKYGVYEYVVQSARGTMSEIFDTIETNAIQSGWQVLAKFDAGVPEKCDYQARVLVLFDSLYGKQIMDANPKTGPFAVADRINIFEDENGLNVAVVNPHSINRTILMDDIAFEEMTENHVQALRKLITDVVPGTISNKQYGKIRKKGYIGKTMGVMAGGKFEDKIKDEFVLPGTNLQEITEKLMTVKTGNGKKWGMHFIYVLPLPEYNKALLGMSGTAMEAKSFSIVKAGSDKSRKKFKCPGIAHAAAYPIEVVVSQEGNNIKISFVDAMFRMKMYFEDAGKWAFMKNMGMPGSIADEMKAQIKSALGITD